SYASDFLLARGPLLQARIYRRTHIRGWRGPTLSVVRATTNEGAPSLRSLQGWVPRTHDLEVCGPHPFAQTAKGWGTRRLLREVGFLGNLKATCGKFLSSPLFTSIPPKLLIAT